MKKQFDPIFSQNDRKTKSVQVHLFFWHVIPALFCHILKPFLKTRLFCDFGFLGMELPSEFIFIHKLLEQNILANGDKVGKEIIIGQTG